MCCRLRALLSIFTLIALVFGLTIPQFRRAATQRAIVEHVRSLGGKAYYDWQLEDKMGPTDFEDFVRELAANPALFANVRYIDLSDTRVTDADLLAIKGVEAVEWLAIKNTAISYEVAQDFARSHPPCRIRK